MKKDQIWTVPNLLSIVRIALIPWFVVQYLRAQTGADYLLAAAIVAVSGLTDLVDGKIARRYNQVSEVGKILDPVADKLTQAAMIFCLMTRYPGVLYLLILFAVKEISIGLFGLALLSRGRRIDGAMWFGKVATTVFYVCMFFLVAVPSLPGWVVTALLLATAGCLLLAFGMYLSVYVRLWRAVENPHGFQREEGTDEEGSA